MNAPGEGKRTPQGQDTGSEGRVRYYPVRLRGRTIGYLWNAGSEGGQDRARLILVLAALDVEPRLRAAAMWNDRLSAALDEGLTALEAMERWKGAPEDPSCGGVPADAELGRVASRSELEQLANPGYEPPSLPPYLREALERGQQEPTPDWGPSSPRRWTPVTR